ncbi:3-keto-disaccharide hydrolase [Anatilimnocola floriformis]|uniref:3-keto-disaccharide hydrolase n=1 Tax=Anatilimnocola floriformis TaxID=2948575 RepID=UPI0020C49A61|nr:DUF1080 domain-containing protein [Anatilimnocola floriformis]
MRRLVFTCLLFSAFAGLISAVAGAADPPKDKAKQTFLNAKEAGLDYQLQGEWYGSARVAAWGWMNCGLQVVSYGGGKFEAVLYRGGLPGAGWDQQTKLKLKGQSNEQKILWLETEGFKIAVTTGNATVYDAYGIAGTLYKQNRVSPTMGLQPPSNAVVLFNGTKSDELKGAKLTEDKLLLAGVLTKMPVGDFRLHIEFRTPFMPNAKGQARGNSGVYIQQRYEVQILDSFGLDGVANECGALYTQQKPLVNMALPPLTWQTYDIWFSQPKWSAEDPKKKMENAHITVMHNGVAVQSHYSIKNKTGGGKVEGIETFPINLQDHGNPVTFRNIWIVPSQGDTMPTATAATTYQSCCGRRRCR